MLGKKFIYSQVNKDISTGPIKQALELLNKARICHKVIASAANGVPLAAENRENFFKVIFLDVGLVSSLLGLRMHQLMDCQELGLINQGAISEQVVGQLLRTIEPFYIELSLHYWVREEKNSSAEVDYLIQQGTAIVPVEVKSGSTGQLKSLHVFMALKNLPVAVRINSDLPSVMDIDFQTQIGKPAKYRFISLPFYLVSQLSRIIDDFLLN